MQCSFAKGNPFPRVLSVTMWSAQTRCHTVTSCLGRSVFTVWSNWQIRRDSIRRDETEQDETRCKRHTPWYSRRPTCPAPSIYLRHIYSSAYPVCPGGGEPRHPSALDPDQAGGQHTLLSQLHRLQRLTLHPHSIQIHKWVVWNSSTYQYKDVPK